MAAAVLLAIDVFTPARLAAATPPPEIVLSAPLIGQQFTQQDALGDTGVYDCLPASLTMAISALQSTTLTVSTGNGSDIFVADGSRFAPGETIVVDSEHMLVKSISPHSTVGAGFSMSPDGTSEMYVARGTDGTSVESHAAGVLVQRPADYASVRTFMRRVAGVGNGIGLAYTYGVVAWATDGLFSSDATYLATSADGWRDLVSNELEHGRPLVLYIANAAKLIDESGAPLPAGESSFPGAHAVLLAGLVDGGNTVVIDPWNPTPATDPACAGRQVRMRISDFKAAWGNDRFSNGHE
jgi:hypothetical protein